MCLTRQRCFLGDVLWLVLAGWDGPLSCLPPVAEHDRALDAVGGRMPAEHVGRLVCKGG